MVVPAALSATRDGQASMIVSRGLPTRLPDAYPRAEPAGAARSLRHGQDPAALARPPRRSPLDLTRAAHPPSSRFGPWCCGWPARIRPGATTGFRASWSASAIRFRFIGTLRRECLAHLLITGPRHLVRDPAGHFTTTFDSGTSPTSTAGGGIERCSFAHRAPNIPPRTRQAQLGVPTRPRSAARRTNTAPIRLLG
jgi:hypothetical protein